MNTEEKKVTDLTRVEYYAGQAMQVVMSETNEMVPATFSDFIKQLLHSAGLTFLKVNFKEVPGVYQKGAERALKYAKAMDAAIKKDLDEDRAKFYPDVDTPKSLKSNILSVAFLSITIILTIGYIALRIKLAIGH